MIGLIFDLVGIAGICMLGYGLYLIEPTAMFITLGIIFIAFSLFAESGTIILNVGKRKVK